MVTTSDPIAGVLYVLLVLLLMLWPFVPIYCAMDAADRVRARWFHMLVFVVVLVFYPFAWVGWLVVRGYWPPLESDADGS